MFIENVHIPSRAIDSPRFFPLLFAEDRELETEIICGWSKPRFVILQSIVIVLMLQWQLGAFSISWYLCNPEMWLIGLITEDIGGVAKMSGTQ